jgi:hypothetical protein
VVIYSYGYNVNSLRIEIATTYRSAVGLAMTVRLVVIARSEATKQSLIVFFKKVLDCYASLTGGVAMTERRRDCNPAFSGLAMTIKRIEN